MDEQLMLYRSESVLYVLKSTIPLDRNENYLTFATAFRLRYWSK